MSRHTLVFLVLSFTAARSVTAQNTYLPMGSETYHLLDRLETKSGAFSDDLFLTDKGVSRKDVYHFLADFKNISYYSNKSNTDNYNIFRGLSLNGEWALPNGDGAELSAHPWLGAFYKTQNDFICINRNGYFFSLNPVLSFDATYERTSSRSSFLYSSTQGIEMRGRMRNYLGFYLYIANNYEEPVTYQEKRIRQWEAIPGAGPYHKTGSGYGFIKVRGYADVPLIRDHINLRAGYDTHFIGDGIRSLFLSDFAGGSLFAGLSTKIWKLDYQNLYLMLQPQFFTGDPHIEGYKYATLHHLSVNVRPWLNIGLFESVTFARDKGYEIGYINPVIFYRAIERSFGSPDKVAVGINAKAIAWKRVNLYGQFLLNEFTAKEFFGHNGYWANKWGIQLGAKYYDAFTISNLDIQGEMNLVRPYTYAHYENGDHLPMANYSTYNQPLADPLGAGFREFIGDVRYQPFPRLAANARIMYYQQGVDTGGANFGNNIFKDYDTRNASYGVHLVNGPAARCLMFALELSYELRPRLYLDAGGTFRNYQEEMPGYGPEKDLYFHAGFRLNLERTGQNWY